MQNHPPFDLPPDRPVAVVTGASSGLGEVFARRLAERGEPLILVARRLGRLERLADQLRSENGVDVAVSPCDLADPSQADALAERLNALDRIGHLINNAGFGYMGDFADLPLAKHLAMLEVHVTALIKLTYSALPKMIEADRGVVVNVSSIAAWTVGPGQALYNSTKAFVKTFSESLHEEVAGTGVRVLALCPGITRTGFHDTQEFAEFDKSQMPNLWMSAEEVVDQSFAALDRHRAVCVPGFKNRLLASLFRFDAARLAAGRSVRKQPTPKRD